MTTFTEGVHSGEFIVSEANGMRSRKAITVASGNNLVAGAVLGMITASGLYVELDPSASDGSEAAAGLLFAAVDASAANAPGVALVRDAEYSSALASFADTVSAPEQTAAIAELEALGLIGR